MNFYKIGKKKGTQTISDIGTKMQYFSKKSMYLWLFYKIGIIYKKKSLALWHKWDAYYKWYWYKNEIIFKKRNISEKEISTKQKPKKGMSSMQNKQQQQKQQQNLLKITVNTSNKNKKNATVIFLI